LYPVTLFVTERTREAAGKHRSISTEPSLVSTTRVNEERGRKKVSRLSRPLSPRGGDAEFRDHPPRGVSTSIISSRTLARV